MVCCEPWPSPGTVQANLHNRKLVTMSLSGPRYRIRKSFLHCVKSGLDYTLMIEITALITWSQHKQQVVGGETHNGMLFCTHKGISGLLIWIGLYIDEIQIVYIKSLSNTAKLFWSGWFKLLALLFQLLVRSGLHSNVMRTGMTSERDDLWVTHQHLVSIARSTQGYTASISQRHSQHWAFACLL